MSLRQQTHLTSVLTSSELCDLKKATCGPVRPYSSPMCGSLQDHQSTKTGIEHTRQLSFVELLISFPSAPL
jgi:hypothetical protein